jgi:hypothetical protein
MRVRRSVFVATIMVVTAAFAASAAGGYYVEYYRDNLFLGLAYHRVGCLTDWSTIQNNQDYDGFTTNRYCFAGAGSAQVPGGEWFTYQYLGESLAAAQSQLDTCGARTNGHYETPNYAARSTTCSYNLVTNCNSDCWIRYFSTCAGKQVATISPCWGYSYP